MTRETDPIAPKNYFAYISLVLITVFLTLYLSNAYNIKKNAEESVSVLDGTIQKLEVDELESFLIENKDAVIFVTDSTNENIELESLKFLNVINTYNLESGIVYVNVEGNSDYEKELKEILPSEDIPNLYIYEENEFTSSLSGADGYSSAIIISFLGSEGIIEVEEEISE